MIKIILPIVAIALIFASVGYLASKQLINKQSTQQNQQIPTPSPSVQPIKTFKSSSVMKFSINVPEEFKVEEKLGAVVISSPLGIISIDQNGTNFSNLEDYLDDLSVKNKFVIEQKENLTIKGLTSISGFINYKKTYFIFREPTVYYLSTSSERLYSDLDQIAQSFRYTP